MEKQATEPAIRNEKGTVILTCPHCGKEVELLASCYRIDKLTMPVVVDDAFDEGRPFLDWSQVEGEGDFEYVCPECDEVIVQDLDTVYGWLLHGQHNAHLE